MMRRYLNFFIFFFYILLSALTAKEKGYYSSIDEVFAGFLQENGGLVHLESINSVRLVGEVVSPVEGDEDRITSFVAFRKRPNLQRVFVGSEENNLVTCYDGTWVWRRTTYGLQETVVDIEGDEARQFIIDSIFDGDLLNAYNLQLARSFHGVEKVDDEECYKLVVGHPYYTEVTLFITVKDFRLINRQWFVGDGAKRVEYRTKYSNFKNFGGIWFPGQFESYENGVFTNRVSVKSLKFNVGLFDSFFYHPNKKRIRKEDREKAKANAVTSDKKGGLSDSSSELLEYLKEKGLSDKK